MTGGVISGLGLCGGNEPTPYPVGAVSVEQDPIWFINAPAAFHRCREEC